ncbi:wax ester/triacylglycerol synthase family O-acyltransferase [Amycolatopsis mongoliensis]|uniref:diacylglycerol O-acyltransferase n=1 Tax=Amycolatopsis mongoliensis TaxID=715475 RepID=A0A9Y2NGC0_9PSEU|nr:wax ester/triacylglycerol synthase domain-containing protein [Amycolatopsis sp. 4-36]WIX98517.1 wax ester/triacylglycerol synthase family O-acyltransferase [Amycolatopsis sp. 4-36]
MTRTSNAPPPAVDRASATDRAFLAMDTADVPEQFGVILRFGPDSGFDLARVRKLIAERVPAVPRLRRLLVRTPFGGGGPIWVDDDGFDIRHHVRAVECPAPGDEQALLETAVSLVETPLRRDAPLWSVVLVTGLAGGEAAVVIVLHHVLADGVGGLAVLGTLVDGGAGAPGMPFPRPRPTAGALVREAFLGRLRALRRGRQAVRALRTSLAAGGGLHPPRATPCSLVRPTGRHHRLAVVRADLGTLRSAAHRLGASANDAVLVAVAGALHRLLAARGELVDTFVITVPVSGRRADSGAALGNMVSPMLVAVPGTGDVAGRLQRVAAEVRANKAAATGPPPIAVLGAGFRLLAALGGYRWYMNHQRRMHTLVSHVRGPAVPVTFGGVPIASAIPVGVGDGGNMTVFFEVLSYAGTLAVSVVADRDHFPDLGTLADGLRAELALVAGADQA